MHTLARAGDKSGERGVFVSRRCTSHTDTPYCPRFAVVDARGGAAQGSSAQQGGGG